MDILVTYISVNRRGQQQRDQKRVAGPSIDIGRGTQCQIHLPDPRIALQHAHITVSEAGSILEAEPGRIQVNGRALDGAKLAVGDRIEVGPYVLEVEAPPSGVPLALTVTLVSPLPTSTDERRFSLRPPRISKRRLAYIGFAGTLLLCLLIQIIPDLLRHPSVQSSAQVSDNTKNIFQAVSAKAVEAWNPGPVSNSHQTFGADCRKCHQIPFVHVRDQACIVCHKSSDDPIPDHVPKAELNGPHGAEFRDMRCAQCHRDHKGMQMAPKAEEQCADCHRDVKNVAADAKSENVTDFRSNHPEFRLAMVDADKPDAVRFVRQSKQASPDLVEHSNLKFNHKLHLDPKGVRNPQRGRVVMECANCHQPTEDGMRMAPVTMKDHCQECHLLAFEPGAPGRQVVHGDEKQVMTMLREFYARLVLGEVPPGVIPPRDLPRMRPGAVVSYQERRAALQAADQKANQAFNELFTEKNEKPREVCIKCHEVSRDADGWKVAPVRFTRVWMPQAMFSHAKHGGKAEDCASCHKVKGSETSSSVAMPDIAVCRTCHVGAHPVEHKVTSDCAMCHKFHAGRDYLHGLASAKLLPQVRR